MARARPGLHLEKGGLQGRGRVGPQRRTKKFPRAGRVALRTQQQTASRDPRRVRLTGVSGLEAFGHGTGVRDPRGTSRQAGCESQRKLCPGASRAASEPRAGRAAGGFSRAPDARRAGGLAWGRKGVPRRRVSNLTKKTLGTPTPVLGFALPYFFQRLPARLSQSLGNARAGTRSSNFPFGPRSAPASEGGGKGGPSLSRAGGGGPRPASLGLPTSHPSLQSRVPGRNASLGHPGSSAARPAKLVSGASAPGDFRRPARRLGGTPGSPRG